MAKKNKKVKGKPKPVKMMSFSGSYTTKNKKTGKKKKHSFSRTFGIYSEKVGPVPVNDLSTKWEADQNSTTGVVASTQKLVELSFTVTLSRALGRNPLKDLDYWKKIIGRTGVISIRGKRFGAKQFSLLSVDTSELIFDDFGRFHIIRINVNFIEKNKTKSKKLKADAADKSAKKPKNKNVAKAKTVKKNSTKTKKTPVIKQPPLFQK
jgi:hypothetical protein